MKTDIFAIEVKRVLLKEWDPIGIPNIPEAGTEYDGYVLGLCRLLREFQSVEKIYEYLFWIVIERMGLEVNESHTMAIAKMLVNLPMD